jgi:hypothetical protein
MSDQIDFSFFFEKYFKNVLFEIFNKNDLINQLLSNKYK